MVRESGEVDADADGVWHEVDSKPEKLDDGDKDGALIPFATTGDVEGDSEIKPFISFCGAGDLEGVAEEI